MIKRLLTALPVCLCLPAAAQQFTHQSGAIPGTAKWSEGVECADVDNDGDLDIFFADGNGFSSPGAKQQNVLVVNLHETTPGTFADESVARLGTHISHAKMVITGDIQNDGWVDALFCNAFATDLPFLYVNKGVAQPGHFDFDGSARGLTTIHSSGGGMFGDVDNDGDLDLVLNDAYLGGGSGKPHLYVNDGTGSFSDDAAFQTAAPAKSKQMDVQLVDIDGDWDLDVFAACRAENGTSSAGDHYLMLNDGSGGFVDDSETVPDGQSNSVYEIEVGDLDGDTDLDLFFVSLSGFADGPMTNGLVGSGTLSFSAGTASGGDDDNEVALLDHDNDGDYDAFIGSLAFGSGEKVFVNNGAMSFSQSGSLVQSVPDSTLDMTVADVDNDGAYDLITAQGESNSAQWANKIYLNGGAADTLAPVLVREETLPMSGVTGTWVVRAEVRDQVLDDGQNWVTGEVRYVVLTAPATESVDVTGGGWSPATISVSPGTTVTWTNQDAAAHSVVSTTDGYGFDSGSLAMGESFSYTFVSGGTFTYNDGVGAAGAADVMVSGSPTTGAALATGNLYRFQMDDTAGGAGTELAYELRFTDFAGNLTVSASRKVALATVASRSAGSNPASFSATSPILGGTMTLTVDVGGTTGHSFAVPFGFDSPFEIEIGPGKYLLCLDLGGNGELLTLPMMAGPTPVWNAPVPAFLSLLGVPVCAQALHFGGVVPYRLSNAQDLVIGY